MLIEGRGVKIARTGEKHANVSIIAHKFRDISIKYDIICSMGNKSDFLGKENLRKLFWRLAIPAIVSQLITLIYNIVDRIYIGHIGSEGGLALTGLGVCAPLILMISAFSQLICVGGGPVMSYALGEKKQKEAESVVKTCFIVLVITGVVLTGVMLLFARPLLYLFGASDVTYDYAYSYFMWYVFGTVSVLISTGMLTFITAQGLTKVAMFTVSLGAIVNIILDPVFIWGLGLGIKGAAIATVLSQTVSAVLVLMFLLSSKPAVSLKFADSEFRTDVLKQSLALGISPFIMQLTECGLSIAFNKSLLAYGGDVAVGAMTIFTTANSIFFLPVSGFCQGSQSITSYNYGAGLYERVAENVKRLIVVCVSYGTLFWIFVMAFPGAIVSIFTSDQDIYSYAVSHIRIFFAMQFITALQPSCQLSFLALKNAKVSLFLALLRKVILLIPLIFILPLFMQVKDTAVLLAEPIADTIAVTVTTTTFFIINRDIFKHSNKKI